MALAQIKKHTVNDIYALPDGERAELIDGQIYMMAPPKRRHQELVSWFTKIIGNYIDKKEGSCQVYPAPFAVFLSQDDTNYVEPDISVICDLNKLNDKGCGGAPDWIIEIVSPSSKRMDYYVKLFKYRTAGVREYWIINPDTNRVMKYDFEGDDAGDFCFSEDIPVSIYPDFIINMSGLMNVK